MRADTTGKGTSGQDQWWRWLAGIHAQNRLVIIAACESAAAASLVRGDALARQAAIEQRTIEQFQRATGENLIATARQVAYEGHRSHGVLMYGILGEFQKAGDASGDQKITVDGLAQHASELVPEISKELYVELQDPIRRLSRSHFSLGLRLSDALAGNERSGTEVFIVVQDEKIRDEPKVDATVMRFLTAGYRVSAKFLDGWALLCRASSRVGYATSPSVARINDVRTIRAVVQA